MIYDAEIIMAKFFYDLSSVVMQHYLHMVQIRLQREILQNILQLSMLYSFSSMGYWKPDGKIVAGPNPIVFSILGFT